MPLRTAQLKRVFRYNAVELQDPFPDQPATSDAIRRAHAAMHAPLTNAKLDGPVYEGNKEVWTYTVAVGVKG